MKETQTETVHTARGRGRLGIGDGEVTNPQQGRVSTELGTGACLPSAVSYSVVAKEQHGYGQGDDDYVEGECDECMTADNSAGQSCFNDAV
jgi:hypothetical protein